MSQTSNQEKNNTQTMSDEEKEKHGCFDGLKQKMNKIGNTIQKEFDAVGHKLTSEIYQHTHAPVLHNFVTGKKFSWCQKSTDVRCRLQNQPMGVWSSMELEI